MLTINISSPLSVMQDIKNRYKHLRLFFDFTQSSLAKRSEVSLGSIKRFESRGKISFESFLKIFLVLECLDDFNNIANPQNKTINSIDELINVKNHIKKRGTIK